MTTHVIQPMTDGLSTTQNWLRHNELQPSRDASFQWNEKNQPPTGPPKSSQGSTAFPRTVLDHQDIHVLQLDKQNIKEIEKALVSFLCKYFQTFTDYVNKDERLGYWDLSSCFLSFLLLVTLDCIFLTHWKYSSPVGRR